MNTDEIYSDEDDAALSTVLREIRAEIAALRDSGPQAGGVVHIYHPLVGAPTIKPVEPKPCPVADCPYTEDGCDGHKAAR